MSPAAGQPALEPIAEAVAGEVGDAFFRALVQAVAKTLGVSHAFVSEFTPDRLHFRTLAAWGRGEFLANFSIPLAGSPCEAVLRGAATHHARGIQALFPADTGLAAWGGESYCGVPIVDASGTVFGHLAIIHEEPMPDGAAAIGILRILSIRVRAEIERQRAEDALARAEARSTREARGATAR